MRQWGLRPSLTAKSLSAEGVCSVAAKITRIVLVGVFRRSTICEVVYVLAFGWVICNAVTGGGVGEHGHGKQAEHKKKGISDEKEGLDNREQISNKHHRCRYDFCERQHLVTVKCYINTWCDGGGAYTRMRRSTQMAVKSLLLTDEGVCICTET